MLDILVSARGQAEIGFVPTSTWASHTGWSVADQLLVDFIGYEWTFEPSLICAHLGHPVSDSDRDKYQVFGYPMTGSKRELAHDVWAANMRSFFSDWKFVETPHKVPGENAVSHFNVRGVVESANPESRYIRPKSGAIIWYPNIKFSLLDSYPHFDVDLQGSFANGLNGPLFQSFSGIADAISDYDTGNGVWGHGFRNLSYHFHNPHELRIFYDRVYFNTVSNIASIFPTMVSASLTPTVISRTDQEVFPTSEHYSIALRVGSITAFYAAAIPSSYTTVDEVLTYLGNGGYSVHSSYGSFTEYVKLEAPVPYLATEQVEPEDAFSFVGYDRSASRFYETGYRGFDDFVNTCKPLYRNCYALQHFAVRDAIDTYLGKVDVNFIETLSDLRDLSLFVRAPLKLIDLVRDRHSLFESWLKNALSALADAKLTYEFGIVPTVSDALEVSVKARKLMKLISNPNSYFNWQTAYGEFVYPIPPEFTGDFPGMVCEARAKVRLKINADSFLPYILTTNDAIGILPSLSRVWDLIPFSFVVDWFFNIGGKLEYLDDNVRLQAFDIDHSVSSILITYTLTDEDMAEAGVVPASYGEDTPDLHRPQYRYFDRVPIYRGLPGLTPTNLPILEGQGIPDWGTGTALVYKML